MKRSPASREWGRRGGRARPVWGPRAKRPPPARPDRSRGCARAWSKNGAYARMGNYPAGTDPRSIFPRASSTQSHRDERPTENRTKCRRVLVVALHAFCSPSARQSAAREIRRGRGTRPARTPAGSARTFARLAGGKRTRESSRRGAFRATEASRRARPATKTTGNDGERAVRADGVQVV